MKKAYGKEDLLENLPDFIEGKIDDTDLKEAILFEISNNTEFKEEYEMFSATVKNFNKFEFTEPPANYFNNLLPRLNDKINIKKEKFVISKSISMLWKLAIPVAALVLFFFSYKTFFINNEYTNSASNDTHVVFQYDNRVNSQQDALSSQEAIDTEDDSDNIYDFENVENLLGISNVKKQNKEHKLSSNFNINNVILNDIAESSQEEDSFFLSEDESNYEQIYDNMDKDQKNDILNKIKKF